MNSIVDKLKKISATFNAKHGYTGSESVAEIEKYLDEKFRTFSDIILEGSDLKPNPAALEKGKAFVRKKLANLDLAQVQIQELRSGATAGSIMNALIKKRLRHELGKEIVFEEAGLRKPVEFAPMAPGLIGIDEGNSIIFFNPSGALLFTREEKLALIKHEWAHVLLGHLEKEALTNDRRQPELDADHVGIMMNHDSKSYISAMQKIEAIHEFEKTLPKPSPELMKAEMYKAFGKVQGEDVSVDKFLEHTFAEMDKASKWVYPTMPERLEKAKMLADELKFRDMLIASDPRYMQQADMIKRADLQTAIEARHINNKPVPQR